MNNKLKSVEELKELTFELSQECFVNLRQTIGLQDYFWLIDLDMSVGKHFNAIGILNKYKIKNYHFKNYEAGKLLTRIEVEIGE